MTSEIFTILLIAAGAFYLYYKRQRKLENDYLRYQTEKRSGNQNTSIPSSNSKKVVASSVNRLVQIVNESLKLANESKNYETRISRLKFAKERLEDLKAMERKYPYVRLTNLDRVESDIQLLDNEINTQKFNEIYDLNQMGKKLEKKGKIEAAIELYEEAASEGAITPFTYRRLAILYRKRKDQENEIRAIKLALQNVEKRNAQHYKWFQDRLDKILSK